MSEKIPENWTLTELSNIVIYKKGKKPKKLINEKKDGYIPYVNIKAFEQKIIDEYADMESSNLIDESDILVVWDGARFGLSGTGMVGAAGSTLMVLKPLICYPRFVHAFINRYYRYINSKPKGSGTPHVNPDIFWNLPFPLPPLYEQKRIVAKLDAIIPRIDSVKERLEKIPAILKRFRQSVLTAAVTGKLTEKWREEHLDVESAEKLIKKVFSQRINECLSTTQKEKVKEIFCEVETENSEQLPITWRFVFLKKICKSFQYGTSKKSQKEGKIPVLRMGNLQEGKLDWSDLAYTSNESEIKKFLLKKNTVLFNRTNSPELVGKTSIYTGERKAIFAGYLIRINNYDVVNAYYLNYTLNSGYAKEFCYRKKSDGVSQSNINAQKLAHFELPLPPLEEQKEIVRQVDKLFALADKVEAHYRQAKEQVDKLSQSVLAKAFRGELVPQDPTDEPAEKLLEQILEEKAKMEATLKKAKKKSTTKKTKKKGKQ